MGDRRYPGALQAAPEQHQRANPARGGCKFLQQPRLADPWLAGDQHQAALAAKRSVQRRVQLRQLSVSANERPARGCRGRQTKLWRRSQVGMHQRKNMLRSRQALQAVLPNIGQARPRWQLVGHQFGRPLRKQDMTTLSQRP
jgi:hypothetical protein